MPEIKVGEMFKVTVTEYEAGWGQRSCPELTKFFSTKQEADKYAQSQNTGSYEYYLRADVTKV